MDFSDPQGGKGPCDRKAANIKNHMRSYLNSGHDISTASEMKCAIVSNGGVHGVSVIHCDPLEGGVVHSPKWDGVSAINDIVFKDEKLVVWRAYNVGKGKSIRYDSLDLPDSAKLPRLSKIEDVDPPSAFFVVKPRKKRTESRKETDKEPAVCESDSDDTDTEALFTCPEEGCIKAYQEYAYLERHLDLGTHQYLLEKETFLDKAMLKYAECLESGESSVEGGDISTDWPEQPQVKLDLPTMGWALKGATTGRRRFTDAQKNYLTDLFILGERSGQKADPDNVAKGMRKARSTDGSFLFHSDEYLTAKQIAGFFSRLSSKKSLRSTTSSDDDDDLEDILPAMNEMEVEQLREEVLDEMLVKHPITYDSYNICEMAKASTLNKFSLAMLRDICAHFEFDTSVVRAKRKKQPYIDVLIDLVKSCQCNGK